MLRLNVLEHDSQRLRVLGSICNHVCNQVLEFFFFAIPHIYENCCKIKRQFFALDSLEILGSSKSMDIKRDDVLLM